MQDMEQLRMMTILEMSLSNSISKAVHRRDIHSSVHFLSDGFSDSFVYSPLRKDSLQSVLMILK